MSHRKEFRSFELSYNLKRDRLQELVFLKGRVLSVHAPCPETEFYPNFGSNDTTIVEESFAIIEETLSTAVEFGARRIVLHPGYTLDVPVYTEFCKRNSMIKDFLDRDREFALFPDDTFCTPKYSKSSGYMEYLNNSFGNLERAAELCKSKGVELAIENLNPRLTYLYQSPDDILSAVRVVDNLGVCLDLGHLWITTEVYRLDFIETVKRLARAGMVSTVHVHDNNSRFPDFLADQHLIPGEGIIPIIEAVKILKESGTESFIIEAVGDNTGRGIEYLEQNGLV